MYKGTSVLKTDSNRYGGFESTQSALVEEDIELTINQNIFKKKLSTQKVQFENQLSKEYFYIKYFGIGEVFLLKNIYEYKNSIRAVILDLSHGFGVDDFNFNKIKKYLKLLLQKSKIIRYCFINFD